jgi:hypothetical protein
VRAADVGLLTKAVDLLSASVPAIVAAIVLKATNAMMLITDSSVEKISTCVGGGHT